MTNFEKVALVEKILKDAHEEALADEESYDYYSFVFCAWTYGIESVKDFKDILRMISCNYEYCIQGVFDETMHSNDGKPWMTATIEFWY